MGDYISKWHKELEIFSKIKPLLILEGDVLDSYQYPKEGSTPKGSILRLSEYLHFFFKDSDYRNIIFYDSLRGFYNNCEEEYTKAFAKLVNAPVDNHTIKCTFKGRNNTASDIAYSALTQNREASVIIMNFASRYIVKPDNMDQSEVDSFTLLLQSSLEAKDVRTENGNILKNLLVLIVNKTNDLPAWFYLQNPNVKTITVTYPSRMIVLTMIFIVMGVLAVVLVGLSVWIELLVMFDDGIQIVPLVGCLLSIIGISFAMSILKIKKPQQNIVVEVLLLTMLFGLFEGTFLNSEKYIDLWGKDGLFYATVGSQPFKCFIGWLVSIVVNYNLEEKVDALRIKIQNYYATQVTQLKECKDIIIVNACGQRRAELLIKLLESVGCLKLGETFCNESRKINKEVVEKIQTILDGTRLNVIRKDMSLYEIDQELSVQLKRATELCETYQNGKYTVQDYKELKYVYRKCI